MAEQDRKRRAIDPQSRPSISRILILVNVRLCPLQSSTVDLGVYTQTISSYRYTYTSAGKQHADPRIQPPSLAGSQGQNALYYTTYVCLLR